MLGIVDGPAFRLARDRSLGPVRRLACSMVLVLRKHARLEGDLVDSRAYSRKLFIEAALRELRAVVERRVLLLLRRCIFRDDVLAIGITSWLE